MSQLTIKQTEILKTHTDLTNDQVQKFFSKTPKDKIRKRPGKGGSEWSYVSGSYVTQVLNSLFGFDWSFTVDTSMEEALKTAATGTVVVKGRLTAKIGESYVTKEQYGRKEVAYRKDSKTPLDFGNDLKAAATDAKKKCASELGLFVDVYAQEDFFEAEIVTDHNIDEKIQSATTEQEINQIFNSLSPSEQKTHADSITKKLKEVKDGSKS